MGQCRWCTARRQGTRCVIDMVPRKVTSPRACHRVFRARTCQGFRGIPSAQSRAGGGAVGAGRAGGARGAWASARVPVLRRCLSRSGRRRQRRRLLRRPVIHQLLQARPAHAPSYHAHTSVATQKAPWLEAWEVRAGRDIIVCPCPGSERCLSLHGSRVRSVSCCRRTQKEREKCCTSRATAKGISLQGCPTSSLPS